MNYGRSHLPALGEAALLIFRYRQLTWELARREFSSRYAGQVFGVLWGIGHPLILICVYVFIFGFVFKVNIGTSKDLPFDYTTYILSGLIPWVAIQESMNKSTTVITSQANLVKQVVFPIELLPLKGVIASSITQLVGTLALIGYVLIKYGDIHLMWALFPFAFLFHILAVAGLSYILSAVGVYLRDTKDFVQVFFTIGMYIIPVVYLPTQVPRLFLPFIYANPFSYLIWCYQDVFYFGRFEHPIAWVVMSIGSVAVFSLGFRIFRKLKGAFGNML